MLASDYQQALAQRLAELPCEVKLPAKWADLFAREGHLPSLPGDRRRYVRKHRPGLAVLEISSSLPAVVREPQTASVLTKNVSRAGLSFLHTAPLYPEEQVLAWLPEGKRRLSITRCRRVGQECFEIGAHYQDA